MQSLKPECVSYYHIYNEATLLLCILYIMLAAARVGKWCCTVQSK